jgi:glucan phosphoethanolaminetransferase (alkaline phosphatase superfamily)
MRLFHLIFGISVVIVFLLTGQYMDIHYHHMVGVPDGLRLLYRTRHIFILLAGLLNLALAAYLTYRLQLWRKVLQWMGSALIVVASVLFIAAFFYEPKLANLYTPLSHWGTYTILAGTFLHLLSGAGQSRRIGAG